MSLSESQPLSAAPKKRWTTICRKYSELRLPNGLTLQQWAARGRLLSDDYIFDRAVETWVPARDLAELKSFFRKRTIQRATRVTWGLLVVAALSFFGAPMFAKLVFVAALVSGILAYRFQRDLERGDFQ